MTEWRKSSRSGTSGGDCVEVANLARNIGVRDSKNPDGPKLALPSVGFRELVAAIKRGDHDLS
ncbi:DUF397 domain-containing protein [Actinomadura macrotermitis]|uniref:DUF397 domain-containing protein n=1 Tax=Actinomadura macrotermitis TaxID=2585200 RepID=A0A7K0C1V0_9ACTN|nr:DUF397 domain-containing protein [Actinomadura macrotermitis]MQY07336.1 hypothetical protein [Actinomadura macrotermitis]